MSVLGPVSSIRFLLYRKKSMNVANSAETSKANTHRMALSRLRIWNSLDG